MKDKKLDDILNGIPGKRPEPEPTTEQEETVALGKCAKVSTKGCRGLDVELRDKVVYLPYALLTEAEFTSTGFTADFDGFTRRKLTVEGRNLRFVFERMGDHCLRAVRQLPERDFEDGKDPVVTRISVDLVKEKE